MADLIAFADLATYLGGVTLTASEQSTATLCCTASSDAIRSSAARSFEIQGAAADRYFTYRRPYGTYSYYSNYYGSIDWSVVYPSLFSTAIPVTMLDVDDFFLFGQTLGNITVSDTLSTSTFTPTQTWPFNAGAQGLPFEKLVFAAGTFLPLGEGQLKVNAKWGYVTAIPAGVKEIALLQAARWFKRKDAPFGVAGADVMGNAMRLLSKLDPDVEVLLGSYRRWWAAA
jgi:hypothetical protein